MVLLTGIGTYLLRVSAIAVVGEGRQIPPRVEQALRLVAPAVLAALVANSLLLDGDGLRPLGAWHGAGIIAALVAIRFRSAAWTLLAGMVAVWIFSALG
jgi:branched-subunit amino acid transport protein